MKKLLNTHKTIWADTGFTISAILSFLFFIGSLVMNYSAIIYSTREAGSATTDILLQNLPIVNTNFIFSEGALLFAIFVAILLLMKPQTIPFALKSISLFICIRSIFVIMTHLAPPLGRITTDFDTYRYLNSGADLFFSGHTGLPFLMALLFWQNNLLKRIFIFSSIVAAIAVILGHLHYTIDVFSAFFISYGIYHIAREIFPKDYQLFTQSQKTATLA